MSEVFRAPEVARLTGVSYRQLDYWARSRLIEPSVRTADGQGTQRLYSADDVARVRAIAILLDAGVSLAAVRKTFAHPRALEALEHLADRIGVARQSLEQAAV